MNKFIIFIFLFCLSACTPLINKQPQVFPGNNQDNWILQGKIGVKTPERTESASLYWQQQGDFYHIRLFGPLGIGAVEINGNPAQVIFTDNQGKNYQAATAKILLKQNLGWEMPVDNLRYWIRGLPAPHLRAQKIYTHHQLTTLLQQGWKIDYLAYQGQQPRLIQLTWPDLTLRIVIDHNNA